MGTISVVLADDHAVYRAGIRRALELDERFELLGAVDDGAAALGLILETRPDVALLDHDMPLMTGSSVAEELHRLAIGVPVVILTALSDEVQDLLRATPGVHIVLSKVLARRAVCDAVAQAAARGQAG